MKKHLKKLLLIVGFVALTITTFASIQAWPVVCDDGSSYNVIIFSDHPILQAVEYAQAYSDLCL